MKTLVEQRIDECVSEMQRTCLDIQSGKCGTPTADQLDIVGRFHVGIEALVCSMHQLKDKPPPPPPPVKEPNKLLSDEEDILDDGAYELTQEISGSAECSHSIVNVSPKSVLVKFCCEYAFCDIDFFITLPRELLDYRESDEDENTQRYDLTEAVTEYLSTQIQHAECTITMYDNRKFTIMKGESNADNEM